MPASLKYFGTDGIRGKYGGEIINEKFSYSLGIAFSHFLETRKHDKAKPVLLAQDTRLSGGSLIAHCMEGLKERFQSRQSWRYTNSCSCLFYFRSRSFRWNYGDCFAQSALR